jgi:GR25 family glycosyltransferase involved in LPS biosynthesis
MNNPFNFFDRIYCINLPHRTDKWEKCKEEFAKYNFLDKVIRFNGVQIQGSFYHVNVRAAGCFLSHLEIINKCKEENVKNVLILEDDVEFYNDPIKNLSLSINELKDKDWDIFYLGMNVTDEKFKDPLERVSPNLLRIKSALTTHAISYNNVVYSKILNLVPRGLEFLPWMLQNESFDGWLMREFLHQNNCFCPNEYLATQRDSFSDINLGPTTFGKGIMENFYRLRPK